MRNSLWFPRPAGKSTESLQLVSIKGGQPFCEFVFSPYSPLPLLLTCSFVSFPLFFQTVVSLKLRPKIPCPALIPANLHVHTSVYPSHSRKRKKHTVRLSNFPISQHSPLPPNCWPQCTKQNREQHWGKVEIVLSISREPQRAAAASAHPIRTDRV